MGPQDLHLDFASNPHISLLPLNSPACTEIGMSAEQLGNILQWPSTVILKQGKRKIMTEQLGDVCSASLLEELFRERSGDEAVP